MGAKIVENNSCQYAIRYALKMADNVGVHCFLITSRMKMIIAGVFHQIKTDQELGRHLASVLTESRNKHAVTKRD